MKDLILPERDALAEVVAADVAVLQHLAGFELHLPDGRLPVEARALVEKSVVEFEAFGERTGIVRIAADDRVVVNGSARARRRNGRHLRNARRPQRYQKFP